MDGENDRGRERVRLVAAKAVAVSCLHRVELTLEELGFGGIVAPPTLAGPHLVQAVTDDEAGEPLVADSLDVSRRQVIHPITPR